MITFGKQRNFIFLLHLVIVLILASGNLFPSIGQTTPGNYFSEEKSSSMPYYLIIGSFFLDRSVYMLAQENQSAKLDKIADIDRYYGDKYWTGGALLGLYGMSLLIKNEKLKEISEKAMISAAVTGIVVSGLKEVFGRSRPYRGDGAWHFKPFSFKESRRSLPSGHASVTFAISTIMANSIDNSYWKVFWYGSAMTVAAARVYKNDHWFSDVVAGSALGYFIANKTEELFQNKKANPLFGLAFQNQTAVLTISFEM